MRKRLKAMKQHYSVLNVPLDATKGVVTRAYRQLALRYHPDKNSDAGAEEKFKQVGNANTAVLGFIEKEEAKKLRAMTQQSKSRPEKASVEMTALGYLLQQVLKKKCPDPRYNFIVEGNSENTFNLTFTKDEKLKKALNNVFQSAKIGMQPVSNDSCISCKFKLTGSIENYKSFIKEEATSLQQYFVEHYQQYLVNKNQLNWLDLELQLIATLPRKSYMFNELGDLFNVWKYDDPYTRDQVTAGEALKDALVLHMKTLDEIEALIEEKFSSPKDIEKKKQPLDMINRERERLKDFPQKDSTKGKPEEFVAATKRFYKDMSKHAVSSKDKSFIHNAGIVVCTLLSAGVAAYFICRRNQRNYGCSSLFFRPANVFKDTEGKQKGEAFESAFNLRAAP